MLRIGILFKSVMPNLASAIRGVVAQLLSNLSTRNRDVISRRFGLKIGRKETLESIGQSYKITRERVRQIEEASIKQIRGALSGGLGSKVRPFVDLSESILEQAGGVIREDSLFEKFSGNAKEQPVNAALVFFLTLDGKFKRMPEDDYSRTYWSLSEQHSSNFQKSIALLVNSLKKNGSAVPQNAVADFYRKSGAPTKDLSPAVLESHLSITKTIAKNNFGQVGLVSWPEIKPRGVRDKAYLVLKKENKPQHFRDIAKLINTSGFDIRKANVQTVHNELIKDKRFVLVGRGMYGLSEWGYKAGTVKDVIIDIMKSTGSPMHKNDIVAQVLSNRMVKENTIVLNLQDSSTFVKVGNGSFALRDA